MVVRAPHRHVASFVFLALGLTTIVAGVACNDRPPAKPPSMPIDTVGIPLQPSSAEPPPLPPPTEEERRAKLREQLSENKVAEDHGDNPHATPTLGTDAEPDPAGGKFTMADATIGLNGSGPLVATITTSMGAIKCVLLEDKAPNTVANFVGLARGLRPWKSPTDGKWLKQPIYDGTTFHRVIKGFMIQGGDPKGNGTGEPGYVIADEIWAGSKHDHAGQLCMANRGPNTNGAQFFITDDRVPHLDKNYTIFGECSPTTVVHAIASVPTVPPDRPSAAVTIDKVEIARDPTAKMPGGGGPSVKPPRPPVTNVPPTPPPKSDIR